MYFFVDARAFLFLCVCVSDGGGIDGWMNGGMGRLTVTRGVLASVR